MLLKWRRALIHNILLAQLLEKKKAYLPPLEKKLHEIVRYYLEQKEQCKFTDDNKKIRVC